MDKTCIVGVNNRVQHKHYNKVITKTKRYVVQNLDLNLAIGDKVSIQETRPLSKTKNWVITKILRKVST